MTRWPVVIQPPAAAEIEAAYVWIAESNPAAAATWLFGLRAAIQGLSKLPERCPLAPENSAFKEEIRELIYGKRSGRYRIFFTIRATTVHVLHVRHGARDQLKPGSEE